MSIQEGYVELNTENSGVWHHYIFSSTEQFFTSHLLDKLAKTINVTASDDEKIKVIVLKSGGDRTFCAGASFDELKAISNKKEGIEFFSGFAKVVNASRKCKR